MKQSSLYAKLPRRSQLFLWIYCLSFAFDFKGTSGGSAVQLVFFVVAVVSAIALIFDSLASVHKRSFRSIRRAPLLAWIIFLIVSLVPIIYYEIAVGDYARVLLPFFLCGLSWFVVECLLLRDTDPAVVVLPLYVSAAVSMIWTLIYATTIGGVPIMSARFQIIGQGLVIVLAYVLAKAAAPKKTRAIDWLLLLVAAAIVTLSITRSYLITAAALVAAYALWAGLTRGTVSLSRRFSRLGVFALVVVIGAGVAFAVRPNAFDAWQFRMTEERVTAAPSTSTSTTVASAGAAGTSSPSAGSDTTSVGPTTTTEPETRDVTELTRIAEYSYQWKAVTSSPFSVLFGRGVGSRYSWDTRYFDELSQVFSADSLKNKTSDIFAGHSFWVYSIYADGFLGGLIPPILFVLALLFACWAPRRLRNQVGPEGSEDRFVAAFVFFGLVGYLSLSFTANFFALRLNGLIFGALMALAFSSRYRLNGRSASATTRNGENGPK